MTIFYVRLHPFTANIRALMRHNADVIDICHDYRSGLRNADVAEDLNLDEITDQLRELRDILEDLFKATTYTPRSANGSTSLGLVAPEPPPLVVNELLARCKSEMSGMETALKQASGRKRIRGQPSSQDPKAILRNLALSATALKSLMGEAQTYESNSFDMHPKLIRCLKVPHSQHCQGVFSPYPQ